jgi:hypothetical protein
MCRTVGANVPLFRCSIILHIVALCQRTSLLHIKTLYEPLMVVSSLRKKDPPGCLKCRPQVTLMEVARQIMYYNMYMREMFWYFSYDSKKQFSKICKYVCSVLRSKELKKSMSHLLLTTLGCTE